MSVWKKIAGLLFEETDADVIAEDELEDISFPEEEPVRVKYKKTTVSQNEESYHKVYEHTPVEKEEKRETVKEEPKKFVSIEITDQEPQQPSEEVSSAPVRAQRVNRVNVVREDKKDYEVTPVISPIFGSKDEHASVKSSSVSITLPKPKKPNPLGTVISPYYGLGELEEFKAEAQENIQLKEISRQEEPALQEIERFEEEDDVNSLSLDDLIADNDQEEDEEDMMQISLFGDSTPLHDSDSASDDHKEV